MRACQHTVQHGTTSSNLCRPTKVEQFLKASGMLWPVLALANISYYLHYILCFLPFSAERINKNGEGSIVLPSKVKCWGPLCRRSQWTKNQFLLSQHLQHFRGLIFICVHKCITITIAYRAYFKNTKQCLMNTCSTCTSVSVHCF